MTLAQYRPRALSIDYPRGLMRIVKGTPLVLVALLAIVPAPRVEAQIGGLIKKKAAEAVKGKDSKNDQAKTVAKDEGPITSQFEKECGPVTPETVDKFYRGLQAEIAGREAYDRKLAGTKPDEEVNQCRGNETISPDGIKIVQRGLENGGTTEYVTKQLEKNRQDLETYLLKKCGVGRSKVEQEKYKDLDAARKAGISASGLSENCYDKLKEFALAFCKDLTPAQQKVATEQGIKVPGHGSNVFWVFTADEAKAMFPRCGDLMKAVDALGDGK
jgi:hypothetical protein